MLFQQGLILLWIARGQISANEHHKNDSTANGLKRQLKIWGSLPSQAGYLPPRWESSPTAGGWTARVEPLPRLFTLQEAQRQLETKSLWATEDLRGCSGSVALHSQQGKASSSQDTHCSPTSSPHFHHLLPPQPWKHPSWVSFSPCFSLFFFWMPQSIHSRSHQSLLGVGNISRCSWKHLFFTACSLLQLSKGKRKAPPFYRCFHEMEKLFRLQGRDKAYQSITVSLDFTSSQLLIVLCH